MEATYSLSSLDRASGPGCRAARCLGAAHRPHRHCTTTDSNDGKTESQQNSIALIAKRQDSQTSQTSQLCWNFYDTFSRLLGTATDCVSLHCRPLRGSSTPAPADSVFKNEKHSNMSAFVCGMQHDSTVRRALRHVRCCVVAFEWYCSRPAPTLLEENLPGLSNALHSIVNGSLVRATAFEVACWTLSWLQIDQMLRDGFDPPIGMNAGSANHCLPSLCFVSRDDQMTAARVHADFCKCMRARPICATLPCRSN